MAIYKSKHTGTVIDSAIDKVLALDMDGDGVVDKAEQAETANDAAKLGGKAPEDYSTSADFNAFKTEVEEALAQGVGGTSTRFIGSIMVLSANWVDETETTALFRYRIENSNITANDIVNVYFSPADYTDDAASSLVRATNAGVLAATTSQAGYVDIYSISQPDSDLECGIELTEYEGM